MPTLRLIPYTDWYGEQVLRLCDDATGLLVAPKDGRLAPAGLISAQVMGEKYTQDACRLGEFSPGASVLLVPEPDNPHDDMAVAVLDASGLHRCGYLSRNRARLYHRRLAAGDVLEAISVRGTPAGHPCEQVGILAATPPVLQRVRSPRPVNLPRPAFAGGVEGPAPLTAPVQAQ